ncbi:MAG: lysylphosphatidylglycerol synthase transmembrane domain-containing protein, partial [Myxococcota bacterium]|nr:lysylphosphatidylglycerol synthase transmembrane domain-containing protein [Myxococcota bacterium]
TTDTQEIGAVLSTADPVRFAQATLCWLCISAIKAWRWQQLLAAQGIDVPYRRACHWYCAGLFLGGVSPGRLGELVKVGFIRDLGHPMGRALFSSVLDRLFDLMVLPVVAIVGMALYGTVFADEMFIGLLALGAIAVVGLVTWWAGDRVMRLVAVPVRALMPPAMREEASLTVEDFLRDFRALRLGDWVRHGVVTALCWVLYGAAAVLLARGIGLAVAPVWIGVAVLAAALAGLIPITVSGIGTRDAVLAGFFARVGIGTAPAIALSTLLLGLNLVVVALYWPAYHLALRGQTHGE